MKYQPHLDFSAQAISFRALIHMYERLNDESLEDYELLPIVVFAAFSIEAYVNSIGSRKIAFWDQIERISWKKKIEVLHANVGSTANWGAEPLQLAKQVFEIRDCLAHGKSERVSGPICSEQKDAQSILMVEYLKPSWFTNINKDWVSQTESRVCDLMRYLGSLYNLRSDDFKHHSSGHVTNHTE